MTPQPTGTFESWWQQQITEVCPNWILDDSHKGAAQAAYHAGAVGMREQEREDNITLLHKLKCSPGDDCDLNHGVDRPCPYAEAVTTFAVVARRRAALAPRPPREERG